MSSRKLAETFEPVRFNRRPSLNRTMSFAELSSLRDDLEERLVAGDLSDNEFKKEWLDVLLSAGWSELSFDEEVDRRRRFVDRLHAVPDPVRYRN